MNGDLTGLTDDDHPQYLRTTLGGRDVVSTVAAAGSTETLSLVTANVHDVTLSADCTLTLAGATNGVACTMNILLRQGSGAPWLVTWPGSVAWVGGSAPTLETAVNAWNWVTLITLDGGTVWFGEAVTASGGGGGAPTTADYLVGTAQGGLSAEIVVGTTPNGELGGTWGAITVDATHSGSAHHTESHQSRHNNAGADALKLDDLAAPDDNTDLDASTSAHGLLKKLPGGTTNYLRADGTFADPSIGPGAGNVVGYAAKASQSGVSINSLALATAVNLVANGGSYAIGVHVPAIMNVQQVQLRNLDGGSARSWRWDVYVQNGSTNVLDRVATSNGSDSFTGSGAQVRTLDGSSPPYTIQPGYYWLVIQNSHATNTFGIATTAGTALSSVAGQTKTTTNPNGATLDFTAATWTKNNSGVGAVLVGRVFGESTAF
jgi:hypothetical protein